MWMYYKLGNPGITSISVDGYEHKVNPQTGLLEVHTMTPGLTAALQSHNPQEVDPRDKETMEELKANAAQDEDERQILFAKLDEATNRKTDRRKSLAQVRVMWDEWQARQARIAGQQNPALAAALSGRPRAT
jgi:hypothetical protein